MNLTDDEYNRLNSAYIESDIIQGAEPANQVGTTLSNKQDYTPNVIRTKFINPDDNLGIGFAEQDKLIWINMESIPISAQKNYIRPSQPTVETIANAETYSFKFLASMELTETLSHEWAPFESISQSFQQAYGSTMITATNVLKALGIAGASNLPVVKKLLASIANGEVRLESIKDRLTNVTRDVLSDILSNEKIQPWRVDTPLVYKNTERRTYEFSFQLVSLKGKPYDEVVEPVKMLEKLSCPEKPLDAQNGYNPLVIPPNVFKVYTSPTNVYAGYPQGYDNSYELKLIDIPFAALKNVNPTWKGPFVNGHPMRCDLRLTFQEIEPVYARHIKTSTYVTVYDESKAPCPGQGEFTDWA